MPPNHTCPDSAFRRRRTPARADIVDRNGKLLATTLDSPSVYANPKQILDPADGDPQVGQGVSRASNAAELYAKLTSGKSFVYIKRHLTPKEQYEVNQLGIAGVQFQHEERRVYPDGTLTAHVVGYTGIDNAGFAGIERGLDDTLKDRREPLAVVARSAHPIRPCGRNCSASSTTSPPREPPG